MPDGKLRQANLKLLFEKAKQYEKSSFKGLFNFINFIDKVKLSSGDMSAAKIISENENVIRIMSIHKSKGLEFPVVFLAGTGRQFNLKDLTDKVLLHQKLGIGPEYINYDKMISYTTPIKEAMKIKMKNETLSEEERVLYVALTRSKEKLIITGVANDAQKDLENKKEQLMIDENENINSNTIARGKSYLDWLEYVYLKNEEVSKKIMSLNIVKKSDIIKNIKVENIRPEEKIDKVKNKLETLNIEKSEINAINEKVNWEYKNQLATLIPSKASVTKIKELENEENEANLIFNVDDETNCKEDINNILPKPKFLNDEKQLTGAEKGTVMHLILQKLEIRSQKYSEKELKDFVGSLYAKNIITRLEAESVKIDKLLKYVNSDLYKDLIEAKDVNKEKPFYINVKASEIFKQESEEDILVQGIIDLYYVDSSDKLILVDYKTDYVESGKENDLIKKYRNQLELYKKALEEALNKKVYKTSIYSVYLGKTLDF